MPNEEKKPSTKLTAEDAAIIDRFSQAVERGIERGRAYASQQSEAERPSPAASPPTPPAPQPKPSK